MTLEDRDRLLVQLVARFKQVTSDQLFQLVFDGGSRTSCDRALRRLVDGDHLARIERRLVGGSKGGSGQYVYQLGRKGYLTYFEPPYKRATTIKFHSLAIADCWVTLKGLERAGVLEIEAATTEPDSWLTIGSTDLRPDMFVDLKHRTGRQYKLWLEIDMGTESQKQIRAKLDLYLKAWADSDVYEWQGTGWTDFPRVLWVAVDEERERELRWLIRQLPEDSRKLFRLTEKRKLANLFLQQ